MLITAAQQAALEALTGRSLTAAEVSLASARSDATLAQSLSAGRTAPGVLPVSLFAAWCSKTGLRATIEDASVNPVSPLRSGALTIKDLLSRDTSSLDLSMSAMGRGNVVMLEAWVTAGAITPAQRDSLIALAAMPAPIDCNTVSALLNG